MQITTTKKLKGILELPSLGTRLMYDHVKDKSQTITIDDKYASNQEINIAYANDLITIKGKPIVPEGEYGPQPELTAKLINIAKNPITLRIDKEVKEIAPGGSVIVPVSFLNNPHIKCLINKKFKVDDLESVIETETGSDLDIDAEPETIAVVANPNDEKTFTTPQELKKINANKIPEAKKEEKSIPQVYSPRQEDEIDEETEENFVDKIQEKERIKKLSCKKNDNNAQNDSENISDTEAVQLNKMGDTTPVVVQRKESFIEGKTETVEAKPEKKKRGRPKKQRSTEIFDI
jgi:hypothetical protein